MENKKSKNTELINLSFTTKHSLQSFQELFLKNFDIKTKQVSDEFKYKIIKARVDSIFEVNATLFAENFTLFCLHYSILFLNDLVFLLTRLFLKQLSFQNCWELIEMLYNYYTTAEFLKDQEINLNFDLNEFRGTFNTLYRLTQGGQNFREYSYSLKKIFFTNSFYDNLVLLGYLSVFETELGIFFRMGRE